MLAPDFVSHTLLPGQEPTRMTHEGYLRGTAEYHAAVSNGSLHFEDQVAAGEKVVTRFNVQGTHDRGELIGLAPSGGELTYMPIAIHRIVGGKIVEEWGSSLSELRRQRLKQERIERERVEVTWLLCYRQKPCRSPAV